MEVKTSVFIINCLVDGSGVIICELSLAIKVRILGLLRHILARSIQILLVV